MRRERHCLGDSRAAAPAPARSERSGQAGRRPLRVLFVQDHLGQSPGLVHGATRYLLSTLPAFDPSAVEASLCVLTPPHPMGASLLAAAGIVPTFLGRAKWDPRVARDLVRLVRTRDIDLLHLSSFKATMLGRAAALVTGRPAIVHLHDAVPMARWVRLIQHRLVPWTDAAIVVSEAVRRAALENYGMPADRVQVLYNGVDYDTYAGAPPDACRRIRREMQIADGAVVIGMVGRIEPGKGVRPLLKAMPEVLARCPGAVLLVVGDGSIRPECERLAVDLAVDQAVRFTGFRHDIPELLAAMDVAAAPSTIEEGLGYVALEAMCAGLPVVATRSGGLPEVVLHGETGFLVSKGNVPELAGALATIVTDGSLRKAFASAARQRAAKFSVDGHVDRLQALYRQVARSERHATLQTDRSPRDSRAAQPADSGRALL